ncbi:uncharacterized protein TRIADDRAFT_54259 [Trichoplax adhaerens]|uniref:EF-hand domain-containing protein n=1 Tax=Trichoplax adhaerens TaxID=10228 RepID=B3RRJ3_TRIAD|nr:hypothetical protein TRIADDRAFT_54259 [Trichoplax adhaerens]EDV26886.1 hypothetical protein TRIADDRAFT_54259 [Trichoplax adhaerens]|eukprot:XP_002110882.1 hypothetical protein TRIADDRAFT_54259 [Trichoplax adhaerens]
MVKRQDREVGNPPIGLTARGMALSPKSRTAPDTKVSPRPVSNTSRTSPQPYSSHNIHASVTPIIADANLTVSNIESLIASKVNEAWDFIKKGFAIYDESNEGIIRLANFRRVFQTYLFPLTDLQFNEIQAKLPKDDSGNIKYIEFLQSYGARSLTKSPLPRITSHIPNQDSTQFYTIDEIERLIQEKMDTKGKVILKSFRMCDYDRQNKILRNDFRKIMDNFCLRLTDAQFVKLWSKFAGNTSPTLDYVRFLSHFHAIKPEEANGKKPTEPDNAKNRYNTQYKTEKSRYYNVGDANVKSEDSFLQGKSLSQIEGEFLKRVRENYNDLWSTFSAIDEKDDGMIALDRLHRILGKFIFPMPDNLFTQIMDRFGFRATGRMPWKHFMQKFQADALPANGQTLLIRPSHKYNPIMESQKEMQPQDIWNLLNSKIKDGYSSIKQAFLTFDDDKDGRVSHKEMRRIIEKFCFRLGDNQFREIINRLDPNRNGYISYKEFMDIFEEKETADGHKWLKSNHRFNETRKPIAMTWEKAEDILRIKIAENWSTLAKAFGSIDEDKDGAISKSELKRLLNEYAMVIPDEHFKTFWSRCDVNSDGTIQFEEFVQRLGLKINEGDVYGTSTKIHDESDKMEQKRLHDQAARLGKVEQRAHDLTGKMTAEAVMKKLQDSVTQSSSDIRRVFQRYDKDGDGKVSESEFRLVLGGMGLSMSDEQFKILIKKFGFYKGNLSYTDFVDKFDNTRSPLQNDPTVQFHPVQKYKVREQKYTMTAEEVETKLRNKIRDGFQGLREAFYKIDDDHNGAITKSEFRRLLDSMMFVLSDSEFDKLVQKIDFGHRNTLSYQDFLKRFQSIENVEAHPWLFSTHRFNKTKKALNLTHEQVHSLLLSKAENQWNDIAKAFKSFDKDRNGLVSRKEFKIILDDFALTMTDEEFEKLWRIYDTDNSGSIDYREFIYRYSQTLAPGDEGISTQITKESQNRFEHHHQAQKAKHEYIAKMQVRAGKRLTAEEIEARITDRFRDGFTSFRKAFENADHNKDGHLSRKELHDILQALNFHCDEIEYNRFLDRIGLGNKYKLSYEEFLNAFQRGKQADIREVIPKRASPVSYESLPVDKAEQKLRQTVREKLGPIQRALEAFDVDENERIGVKRFRRVLENFCFRLTDPQFKHVLRRLNVSGDLVPYREAISTLSKSDEELTSDWLGKQEEMLAANKKQKRKSIKMNQNKSQMDAILAPDTPQSPAELKEDTPEPKETFTEPIAPIPMNVDSTEINYVEDSPRVEDITDIAAENNFIEQEIAREEPNVELPKQDDTFNNRAPSRNVSALSFSRMSISSQTFQQTEQQFKQFVVSKFYDLIKVLKQNDPSFSGFVYKNDFFKILEEYDFSLEPNQANKLWKKLDNGDEGFINYNNVLRAYANRSGSNTPKLRTPSANRTSPTKRPSMPTPRVGQPSPRLNSGNSVAALVNAEPTEKLIKDKIVSHWKTIRKAFNRFDYHNTGYINEREFKETLEQHRIALDDSQFSLLWEKFSNKDRMRLNYAEFLSYFVLKVKNVEKSPKRAVLPAEEVPKVGDTNVYLADVFIRIKGSIKQQWKSIRRTCKSYDSKNTGYVTQLQFRDILHQYRVDISEDDFFQLMVYYNKDLTNKIQYNEFLKQCLVY